MQGNRSHEHSGAPRRPRRIYEEPSGKLTELAACPDCGASYREGRWTWKTAPAGSYEHRCPACERIRDDYPAGQLHVEGAYAQAHRSELIQMLQNIEERERKDHPLKRIMKVRDEGSGFVVDTTDAKLAQSFGRALKKAHEGTLELPETTSDKGNLARVRWSRD